MPRTPLRSRAVTLVAGSLIAPAAVFNGGAAFAQTPPDAGALLEQQRRAAPSAPAAASPALSAGPFAGFGAVSGLTPEEERVLREVEARYKGQAVSAQRVLDLVTRQLEGRGITVVLQADAQGRVLAVKPVLVGIEVKDARAQPKADLRAMLSHEVRLPGPLDRRQIERNATLLNETPGINASYQLAPGAQGGQTRLLASVQDGAAMDGYASLDNAGNRQIGRQQLTAGLGLNNSGGWGERIALNGLRSEHGRYLQASVDTLLHASGLRGGVNASSFRYAYSVSSAGAAVPYDGEASAAGAQLLLPLDRSEWSRNNLTLAREHKRNAGRANGASTSDWVVDTLSLGLQGQRALPAGTSASYSLGAVFGQAAQRDAQAAQRDEPFLAQSGRFRKAAAQASLSRALTDAGTTLALALTAQTANKNLPGSEKLQLGGAGLMRGREPQLVGGDRAVHAELRLDHPVGLGGRVGGFVERAWLQANVNRVSAPAYQANTADEVTASDAGLRLSYAASSTVVELTLARALRGVPRFMNGSPIDAKDSGSQPNSHWSAHLRASVRF